MPAPEKATEIKAAITAVIAFLTTLWGGLGWLVIIWIACILADYVSGTMAAKREKVWSSDIARDGLWHKAGEIFAVLAAALCDIALQVIIDSSGIKMPYGIHIDALLTPVVLMWYILTEIGSILENSGRLGGKVPKWFKQKVDDYKENIEKEQGSPEEMETPQLAAGASAECTKEERGETA